MADRDSSLLPGYLNGASAQEEALCRRSTLYAHINKPRFYPFHEQGGLWSEGVRIFRQGDDDYCQTLPHERQFEVGVISVAAIDGPSVNCEGNDYLHQDEAELMLSKITAILRIAKLHHQRALVLGAFGCGVSPSASRETVSLILVGRSGFPQSSSRCRQTLPSRSHRGPRVYQRLRGGRLCHS